MLRIAPTHEAMSRRAADWIIDHVRRNPRLLLAAATGSTPLRTYEHLAQSATREPELFRHLRLLKLDEWGGLAMDDPATCETYLRTRLIQPLRITPDRYFGWNSSPDDPQRECDRVAAWLHEHGPIDLCVLGLGANGHLAFNEPAESLTPRPHVARLSDTSLQHPMLSAANRKPTFGLTLGIAGILHSRHVQLLVSGGHKTDQLRRTLEGPITPHFPASFLQLHPRLAIFCDQDAAAALPKARLP
jgi:galactosamine-6-phosphate isomerase